MEILKIVVLGLVPMITILAAVVIFLMMDRKQLTGLIQGWKERFQKQSELNQAMKAAQAKLKEDHDAKLKKLKESQGKQFQMGFSAFLENCRTEVRQHIDNGADEIEDEFYRAALEVYSTSLEATLDRFQSKGQVEYQKLIEPVKEQVMDAVVEAQKNGGQQTSADEFQKTFRSQETHRIQMRGLIEKVYRGGKVVVKDEKDELVLLLEKQLRDRISQQREMLLQLHRLENELEVQNSDEDSAKKSSSEGDAWKIDMPKMMGS